MLLVSLALCCGSRTNLADIHFSVLSEACPESSGSESDSFQQNALFPFLSTPQISSGSALNTSVDSLGALYSQSSRFSPTASRTSWSRVNSASDLSRKLSNVSGASTSSLAAVHYHWCTVCENPKAILKCDGWKRHMKEHETVYPCKANDPRDITNDIDTCRLCNIISPDQAHLDSHNINLCAGKPRRYTRKINLVKHLELHGVHQGSDLADKWRVTLEKRFYSCGFCVASFTTISEQLLHVDNHFKDQEDICNWDFTKVIKGLLLQPGVSQSWHAFSAAYESSAFSWDQSLNRDLQLRLELSEESPSSLALAAFNDSMYDGGLDDPGLTMLSSNELIETCSPLPQQDPFKSTTLSRCTAEALGSPLPYTVANTQHLIPPFSREACEMSDFSMEFDHMQRNIISAECLEDHAAGNDEFDTLSENLTAE